MLAALAVAALLAGPAVQACPAGLPVARDAVALRRELASDHRDVWVAGRVRGDFEAKRGLALHGCEDAVLEGTGTDTVLRVSGDDILIEDLRLEHSGTRVSAEDGALKVSGRRAVVRRVAARDTLYGIAFEQCHECVLEDSLVEGRAGIEANQRGDGIKLWEAHGSRVRRNTVRSVRDVVVWYSRHVQLDDNRIVDGRYGTHFMYAHDARVRRSTLRGNTVGIFVMYSARVSAEDNELSGARGPAGMGIGFKESDAVSLRGNAIVANTVGVYLDYTPRDPRQAARFQGNVLALNGVALRMHASQRGVSFASNDFTANDLLLEVDGNGDALQVLFEDNHWGPYAGYDLDADGVGDVAFQLKRASSDLRDAHPALRYFQGTAALGLYEALSLAMPYFGARVVLEDKRPAMRPHRELAP